MPTLIRLLVAVVVLGIFGFAGMVALTIFVEPGEKDITIKIPPKDLVVSSQPLDVNNLPDPVNVAPKDASSSASAVDTVDPDASASGVKTVDNAGTE